MLSRTQAIKPPKLETVNVPVIKLADCCGSPHPCRYLSINGKWQQYVWLPAPTPASPENHVVAAWPAMACHNCGRILNDNTTTRGYHQGEHKPTDDIISALLGI